MINDFLSPLPESFVAWAKQLGEGTMGHQIMMHHHELPTLEECKVVIVSVEESRGGSQQEDCHGTANAIRRELYQLFAGHWDLKIADAGIISQGEDIEDSYLALKTVVTYCVKQQLIPIIIGGTQDLTFALYSAFDHLEQSVNITSVDSKFDLGELKGPMKSESYLSHIIMQKPNNLFNFVNLGYQTFLVNQTEIELMEKMYFETYRLGALQKDLTEAEPVMRDSDIVSFDVNALSMKDAPANTNGSPNGFNGMEWCALARYAGIGDKVSVIGFFNHEAIYDRYAQTAKLLAQGIWYAMEGISLRKSDFPFGKRDNYIKYVVPNTELEKEIVFFKSDKSGRWWIEMPLENPFNPLHNRHILVPCSYNDYLKAGEGEIPERWWRAAKKLF
jgi:formiminoglutamase